jgi:hypothetical protein
MKRKKYVYSGHGLSPDMRGYRGRKRVIRTLSSQELQAFSGKGGDEMVTDIPPSHKALPSLWAVIGTAILGVVVSTITWFLIWIIAVFLFAGLATLPVRIVLALIGADAIGEGFAWLVGIAISLYCLVQWLRRLVLGCWAFLEFARASSEHRHR